MIAAAWNSMTARTPAAAHESYPSYPFLLGRPEELMYHDVLRNIRLNKNDAINSIEKMFCEFQLGQMMGTHGWKRVAPGWGQTTKNLPIPSHCTNPLIVLSNGFLLPDNQTAELLTTTNQRGYVNGSADNFQQSDTALDNVLPCWFTAEPTTQIHTHTHTHTCAHRSLAHSHTHTHTRTHARSLARSLARVSQSVSQSLSHSLTHSLTRSLTHSLITVFCMF